MGGMFSFDLLRSIYNLFVEIYANIFNDTWATYAQENRENMSFLAVYLFTNTCTTDGEGGPGNFKLWHEQRSQLFCFCYVFCDVCMYKNELDVLRVKSSFFKLCSIENGFAGPWFHLQRNEFFIS